VHPPVGVLLPGAASGHGRGPRLGVDAVQREIFDDVAHAPGVDHLRQQRREGLGGVTGAVGALVIGVLDDGNPCRRVAPLGGDVVHPDGRRRRGHGRALCRRRLGGSNRFPGLHGGDGLIKRLQWVGPGDEPAVDEEAWRAIDAAAQAQFLVGGNGVGVAILGQTGVESMFIQGQIGGVGAEDVGRAVVGPGVDVGEEPVVHGPIGRRALFAGATGGVGRRRRLQVDAAQRKVVEDENGLAVSNLPGQQRRQRLLAKLATVGALEVGEGLQRHRRVELAAVGAALGGEADGDAVGVGLGRRRGGVAGRGVGRGRGGGAIGRRATQKRDGRGRGRAAFGRARRGAGRQTGQGQQQ